MKQSATVAPVVGILFENYQHAVDDDHWVKTGEGDLMMGTIGIETNFKTIAAGGNFQTPLLQTIGKGVVKAKNRFTLHMSFNL